MTQLRDAKVGDQVQITVKVSQQDLGNGFTKVLWGGEEVNYYNYRPCDKIIPKPWEPKVGDIVYVVTSTRAEVLYIGHGYAMMKFLADESIGCFRLSSLKEIQSSVG